MAPSWSRINRLFLGARPQLSPWSPSPSPASLASAAGFHSARRSLHLLRSTSRGPTCISSGYRCFDKALTRSSCPRRRAYATGPSVVVHNQGRARGGRIVNFLLISTISFATGVYFAVTYAPPFLSTWIMGSVPTDLETLSLYEAPDEFSREVDEHIKNSKLALSLRNHPDFTESRPHLKIPEEVRQHNLTAGTLAGPGMIAVPPYYFNEKDGKSMVQIFYVGPDCSGHPGIVHGGFLATMLDEGLARCAFPAMPNKVGVTANLQINYLKPTMAGQFLVLKAKTTRVEGRKAWAEGWIESLEVAEGEEPQKLVEANALFVEPKHAKVLKSLYRVAA